MTGIFKRGDITKKGKLSHFDISRFKSKLDLSEETLGSTGTERKTIGSTRHNTTFDSVWLDQDVITLLETRHQYSKEV